MKKMSIVLAVLALALLFSTCSKATDNPTTIDECISSFMSDINSSDRSGVYKNLNSSSADYGEAATAAYWDLYFPQKEIPFTLSGQVDSGSTVTASITSSTSATYPSGSTLTFTMGEDSSKNAVISTLTYYRPVGSGSATGTIFQ
jgi:hypothetical protein